MGDSFRKVVVGTGTLGLAGNNVLKLTYLPLQTAGLTTGELEATGRLCTYLEHKRLVNANVHPKDGHYTWFKLSEWMLVEIMDIFTKSLENKPFYQFPFIDFLSTYFQILFQECEIVRSEHGLIQAYGSMAFATDLVPGLVMSFIFGQMKLLCAPLKLSLPSYDPATMIEEILLGACLPDGMDELNTLALFKSVVDDRIRSVSLLNIAQANDSMAATGLYQVMVPTFKTMGEILVKIGECFPLACILQISNQKVVQVLVALNLDVLTSSTSSGNSLESLTRQINSIEGLQVMFHFHYPNADSLLNISVKAHVTSLLMLTRFVAEFEYAEVKQIYDFWS